MTCLTEPKPSANHTSTSIAAHLTAGLVAQEYPNSLAHAIAGFDNVGLSMLSVFQAMTLTNWSFTMFRTMDFLSPSVVIYWLVMIVFGAYFVVSA